MLSLFVGCANYHLGSSAPITFKTIYIQPATNHSFAPQAQAIVSTQIRETFIRDGRVQLVANEADADAVLYVDLTDYNSTAAALNSQDTEVANSFDLTLTAEISLFDQTQGSYLFKDRKVSADTQAYIGNPYAESEIISYQQSERQAMTQLSLDMAKKITNEVLSPW
jgi:hypothetical protein